MANYKLKIKISEFKSTIGPHELILVNNCIILLISYWESYCKLNNIKKFLSPEILEVILYRNCIVHNEGKIDNFYYKRSKLKKYRVGDRLNFSKSDFEKFLTILKDFNFRKFC